MQNTLKINLLNPACWLRIFFMVLFLIVGSVVRAVLAVTVLLQALFMLIAGAPNQHLLEFGKRLSNYAYYILLFLTYNNEQKPFPFGEWPASGDVAAEGVEPWMPPEENEEDPELEPDLDPEEETELSAPLIAGEVADAVQGEAPSASDQTSSEPEDRPQG